MTERRPRIGKARKEPGKETQHRDPPQITVGWGRAGSLYRPGLFMKQYFVEHDEACAADIYYFLSEEIERLNAARAEIEEAPFRRPNYSSFSRYFHWFLILGLIERTDKKEPAIYGFLQERVFYRMTDKGKAEVTAWEDPISVRHPEFR